MGIVVAALLVLPMTIGVSVVHAVTAQELFNDGFEATPSFTGWTTHDNDWSVTSGSGHSGSKKAQVCGQGESDDILGKTISTGGYETLALSFYYKVNQDLESHDHVWVEWYDGAVWHQLADYAGTDHGGWAQAMFALPDGANDNALFQFRFRANGLEHCTGSGDKDEFDLDDVTLMGVPLPSPVPGCMDPAALNYNSEATVDDQSCVYPPAPIPGCMDQAASNYNPSATVDDGSCEYPPPPVPGCMDPAALNYNSEATEDDQSCVYPPAPGSISGTVFEDANGNGAFDQGEHGLPEWRVWLGGSLSTLTDADGHYLFGNLDPGTYVICEEMPSDTWIETMPVSQTQCPEGKGQYGYEVGINSDNPTGYDFGNFKTAMISGAKWNDEDADMAIDEGERYLSGWIINATRGQDVKTATTNEGGSYVMTFGPAEAGEWTLTEVNQDGWTQTYPDFERGYHYVFTVSSGDDYQGVSFGNVAVQQAPSPSPEPGTPPQYTGGGNAGTATITVNMTVVNDGGGTKTIADFPLFIDGFSVQNGVPFTVTGYYHTVSETNGYGYAATFSGQCDAGGTMTTSPGDAKTCTITNDDPGKVLGVETQSSPEPSPVSSLAGEVLGVEAPICESPYLTDYLKMGWNNNPDQVKKLQEYLNLELASDGVSLPVTGVFGQRTFAAVKLLQTKYIDAILAPWGIKDPTGFVYITTQWFINTHMGCPNLPMPAVQ